MCLYIGFGHWFHIHHLGCVTGGNLGNLFASLTLKRQWLYIAEVSSSSSILCLTSIKLLSLLGFPGTLLQRLCRCRR